MNLMHLTRRQSKPLSEANLYIVFEAALGTGRSEAVEGTGTPAGRLCRKNECDFEILP